MSKDLSRTDLLPADALRGKRLGLSVSDSPDLARLGLLDTHFRMTLGELARTVIVAGGELYYGGHLAEDGITSFLIEELHRYGRRDRPLKVCLAWTVHRAMAPEEIAEQKDFLGLFGEIHFLSEAGEKLPGPDRGPPLVNFTAEECARSLSSLRSYMTDKTHARIVVGGKREGFQGEMPGIVEEVLCALKRRQPLYLAGGFGGATIDVVRTIRPDDAKWFPIFQGESRMDERLAEALVLLLETVKAQSGWDGFKNGLNDDQNRLLAASYRPSEIAALVGMGLGRLLAPE